MRDPCLLTQYTGSSRAGMADLEQAVGICVSENGHIGLLLLVSRPDIWDASGGTWICWSQKCAVMKLEDTLAASCGDVPICRLSSGSARESHQA